MPIYEYRCSGCGTTFEALLRGNEIIACPQCGGASVDKLISAPFVTGRATQPAGHTCCGREERCDRPPCSEGDGCRCH